MITYILIKWFDLIDRPLNDPTKYIVLKEYENTPSFVGLSPELEYFQENVPFVRPNVDYRLVTLLDTITFSEDTVNVDGTSIRTYNRTYTVIDRSVEEKYNTVNELKNNSNILVFPQKKQLEYLTMYAVIVRRELLGLNISLSQQEVLDKFEAKALKIWKNHITEGVKRQAIINNDAVNIDEDWEIIDPDDE